MQSIKLGSSEIAQWHALILDAQSSVGFYLPASIEQYIVMTLNAYTKNTSIASVVIAIDYLQALKDSSSLSLQKLRDVGDQCLILSGLFPERAARKNLSQEYFTNIGKEAYYSLSFADSQTIDNQNVFYQLFENFSELIKLLNNTRGINEDFLYYS